jgi:hypothetical protein
VGGERPADAALLAAYLAYIKLEQAQGDPARVQVGQHGAAQTSRDIVPTHALRAPSSGLFWS